jgi:hypothetical protein
MGLQWLIEQTTNCQRAPKNRELTPITAFQRKWNDALSLAGTKYLYNLAIVKQDFHAYSVWQAIQ